MSDLASLNKSVSLSSASTDFVLLAKSLADARGDISRTQALARTVPSVRVREVLMDLKAAVAPMSLSNSSALAPYEQLSTGFFASLSAFSAFSKIYNANDFFRVPTRTIIAVLTSAPVAESVSELAAKPLAAGSFATATLETQKTSAMLVISNELARSAAPSSVSMLGNELRRAAGIAVDEKFLALMAATPGITTAASTGVTAANVLSDLTARLNALTIGADSRLWWIVSPKLFKTLSLLQGTGGFLMQDNKIGMINVAPSYAASTVATLIDARQVAAELDAVRLTSTNHATMQLDSDPTSGAYHLVILFQNNMTGLRSEIEFGSIALRSTSVTTLSGYAA
jgi:Phage capsid family